MFFLFIIYNFFLLFGWLAAGFWAIAFLAGGRRPDKQSDGEQLLLFYKEKVGVLGGANAEPDDTKLFPLLLKFSYSVLRFSS